jgi:hypothetical protein
MALDTKKISVGILIVMGIISIIYFIVLFECYKNKTFIYADYVPPPPPADQNPFFPLGQITPLDPEQVAARSDYINTYLNSSAT